VIKRGELFSNASWGGTVSSGIVTGGTGRRGRVFFAPQRFGEGSPGCVVSPKGRDYYRRKSLCGLLAKKGDDVGEGGVLGERRASLKRIACFPAFLVTL